MIYLKFQNRVKSKLEFERLQKQMSKCKSLTCSTAESNLKRNRNWKCRRSEHLGCNQAKLSHPFISCGFTSNGAANVLPCHSEEEGGNCWWGSRESPQGDSCRAQSLSLYKSKANIHGTPWPRGQLILRFQGRSLTEEHFHGFHVSPSSPSPTCWEVRNHFRHGTARHNAQVWSRVTQH